MDFHRKTVRSDFAKFLSGVITSSPPCSPNCSIRNRDRTYISSTNEVESHLKVTNKIHLSDLFVHSLLCKMVGDNWYRLHTTFIEACSLISAFLLTKGISLTQMNDWRKTRISEQYPSGPMRKCYCYGCYTYALTWFTQRTTVPITMNTQKTVGAILFAYNNVHIIGFQFFICWAYTCLRW